MTITHTLAWKHFQRENLSTPINTLAIQSLSFVPLSKMLQQRLLNTTTISHSGKSNFLQINDIDGNWQDIFRLTKIIYIVPKSQHFCLNLFLPVRIKHPKDLGCEIYRIDDISYEKSIAIPFRNPRLPIENDAEVAFNCWKTQFSQHYFLLKKVTCFTKSVHYVDNVHCVKTDVGWIQKNSIDVCQGLSA